jgi:hypothetical protein
MSRRRRDDDRRGADDIDFDSLARPPVGRDSPDVLLWKQAARLQQPLHADASPKSWRWFKRLCRANDDRPGEMVAILGEMSRLSQERRGSGVDWLAALCSILAGHQSMSSVDVVAALRTRYS